MNKIKSMNGRKSLSKDEMKNVLGGHDPHNQVYEAYSVVKGNSGNYTTAGIYPFT